ncbi:Uridine nucleosidase 1 [Zostera marina]|uniref:Uridine nucleosidase 1 n=1 Tax=Zostera marina TaxID=29655 RepID=A0A0K9PPY7_ZOSMR|nr:Uridine nucleosidase 1 [Zostera marina]
MSRLQLNGDIPKEKLIIDHSDLGIEASMTVMMAFQSPELEIVGITTVFGNSYTQAATRNALLLCEMAGYPNVPVAEGGTESLKVYEPNNAFHPPLKGKEIQKTAPEFLVEIVSQNPSCISILALGPLTNLALAIKRDSSFASKVRKIVIPGGSFFAPGNVNPAAETNIYRDPEAADIVFTCGAEIIVVGLNITSQIKLLDSEHQWLRSSKASNAQFYRDWHAKSDGGILLLQELVGFTALIRPDLFTLKKSVVRVETQGICAGHTLIDTKFQKWVSNNPWTDYSPISVVSTINAVGVLEFIKERLMKQ